MIIKYQFFVVLVITLSLCIENSEAGWKFWKKDKETTTTSTTTTTTPISVGRPTIPAAHTGTIVTSTTNSGPVIDINGAQPNNARFNRPNPGTEVGLDIAVPKPNKPGIGNGNGQNYRDWAVDFAGAGESVRNQPTMPSRPPNQGLTTNGGSQMRPSPPTDLRPTSVSRNVPIQPTQPSIAGTRNTPQPLSPRSTTSRPISVQPIQPHITSGSTTTISPVKINQNSPDRPSSDKTWANVVAGTNGGTHGSTSPTSLPRQPQYPGENERRTTPRPSQPHQPNRSTSSGTGAIAGGAVAAVGTGAVIGGAAIAAGTATNRVLDPTKKIYSSNPTYSKGNTVTDEDLEKLSEALYIKETNNANQHITINLQKQTTSSSPIDEAPQPLLTVNPLAFQISTIQRVLSIFDNYQLDTHTNEYISPAQRQEESLLVDTFLSTNVMATAMRFLADKGLVRQDYYEYKDTLRRIWFNLFSRGQGKIGSTGFEHVFMAETKQVDSGTEVLGLHNWIFFNAEETKRNIDYLGYIKKVDLGNKGSIIKMHVKFKGFDKPVLSMFIGTSPELEMALYTVCFYTRPDGNCPVSLGGTKFNIVTRKFRYKGKDLVGTAYPDI